MSELDPFLAKRELEVGGAYYALSALDDAEFPPSISRIQSECCWKAHYATAMGS